MFPMQWTDAFGKKYGPQHDSKAQADFAAANNVALTEHYRRGGTPWGQVCQQAGGQDQGQSQAPGPSQALSQQMPQGQGQAHDTSQQHPYQYMLDQLNQQAVENPDNPPWPYWSPAQLQRHRDSEAQQGWPAFLTKYELQEQQRQSQQQSGQGQGQARVVRHRAPGGHGWYWEWNGNAWERKEHPGLICVPQR